MCVFINISVRCLLIFLKDISKSNYISYFPNKHNYLFSSTLDCYLEMTSILWLFSQRLYASHTVWREGEDVYIFIVSGVFLAYLHKSHALSKFPGIS